MSLTSLYLQLGRLHFQLVVKVCKFFSAAVEVAVEMGPVYEKMEEEVVEVVAAQVEVVMVEVAAAAEV